MPIGRSQHEPSHGSCGRLEHAHPAASRPTSWPIRQGPSSYSSPPERKASHETPSFLGARAMIEILQVKRLPFGAAMLGACAVFVLGCGGRPSIEYRIQVGAAPPLLVEMTVRNPPRLGMTLRGHAARQILRVRDLTARSAEGAKLDVEAALEPAVLERATIDLPTFRLIGPLPSRITIRYAADVGAREGDEHQGYSGRRHGIVGPDLAFFTGRQVF